MTAAQDDLIAIDSDFTRQSLEIAFANAQAAPTLGFAVRPSGAACGWLLMGI